jgi:LPXTG-motif cell wall-anchored protein
VSRYAAAVALGCLGLLAAAGPGWAEPNGPAASTPTTTPAPPASGGQVTVTSSCAGGNETVTVHNGTDAPVPVLVTNFGQRFDQFTVAAAAEHSFVLTAAGAPYDITAVRGDTAVVLFTLSGFPCPSRIDRSFTVTAGSTFTSPEICPPPLLSVTRGPAHGTVRSVAVGNGVGFRYTPAAGFRGSDSFDYQCGTSANQFGTIRLTVVAAAATTTPAPAPAPIPAPSPTTTAPAPQPSTALPATGPSRLPAQLGTGAALLLLGSAAVWFGRRRRSPAGG